MAINEVLKEARLPELRLSPDSIGRYLSATNRLPYLRVNLPDHTTRGLYAIYERDVWGDPQNADNKAAWLAHYRTHNLKEKAPAPKSKIQGGPRQRDDSEDSPVKKPSNVVAIKGQRGVLTKE